MIETTENAIPAEVVQVALAITAKVPTAVLGMDCQDGRAWTMENGGAIVILQYGVPPYKTATMADVPRLAGALS